MFHRPSSPADTYSALMPLQQHAAEGTVQYDAETRAIILNLESALSLFKSKLGPTAIAPAEKKKKRISPKMTHWLFFSSFIWQLINTVIIYLASKSPEDGRYVATMVFAVLFEVVHIIGVVAVSVKLVKQIAHLSFSPFFLVQSYLSTVLLYSGLYMVVFQLSVGRDWWLDKDAVTGAAFGGENIKIYTDSQFYAVFQLFIKFLYFSITTISTTGYGDIFPATWWAQVMVITQQLIGVVYSSTLFSVFVSHFSSRFLAKRQEDEDNEKGHSNQSTFRSNSINH